MEDLLAMKDTARSADLQRKHRGPVRTDLTMDKVNDLPPAQAKNCQGCELWLRAQKAKQQKRFERQRDRTPAPLKGNPMAGWHRYMSGRRAQEVREMSLAEYKNWPGRDE